MIRNKDIVITGLQPWNFALGSNIANIARTLSKDNRVLFINYAFDRGTVWRRRSENVIQTFRNQIKTGQILLEKINPQLWVLTPGIILESINQIGFRPVFDFLNKLNGKRFAREIKKAIDQLGFRDIYLFTDSDFYRSLYLKEFLDPDFFIYYIRDNMIATDYYRKHGKRIEETIMKKADIIAANSEYLAAYARKVNSRAWFVGQGCDLELYNPKNIKPLPEEVRKIQNEYQRVIGYIGALKSIRIDQELLAFLASRKPGWAFLLVGPEDVHFQKSDLHNHPNIIFLGMKKENELPSYIDFLDVAINPQKVNEITRGNYPRKIDEYLAMGKPVVATRTEAMEFFTGHVSLASTHEEFLDLIEREVSGKERQQAEFRMQYASQHSWENNIEQISQKIEGIRSH